MNIISKLFISFICIMAVLGGCKSTPSTTNTENGTEVKVTTDSTPKTSEYAEFSLKFEKHGLPYSLPAGQNSKNNDLDKKYIHDLLDVDFTPAFGKDDVLPKMNEDVDKSKYYALVKLKLDSFEGYIIHKQADDDYYFLCIFDKQGRFTDGTWIAFTEGSNDDGTIREASINEDGSIEISQYDMIKGRADKAGAQRHFYEITPKGRIKDFKDNNNPGNA